MNVGKPQPCPRPHRDLRRRIERRMTAAFLLSLSLTVAVGAQSGAGLDGAAAASQAARPARILYASDWAFPANQIYVADPAAGKPMGRVTFGPAPACRRWLGNWCGFDAPEPSPDGRKVLIWFRHHTPGAGKDLATAYVSRAGGRGGPITVASAVPLSRFDDPLAGWSSDSRRIAYRSEGQWHVVGADGKGARSVPWPTWAPDPGWSPDHRWLVTFGRKEFTLTEARGNVSRTFPIQISETLAWSPDSGRLAVVALDGQGIYIFDTKTRGIRLLTAESGRKLAWSPDGTSIAFVSRGALNRTDAGDLRVVDLAGRVRTVVDAAGYQGGDISALAWTRPPKGTTYRRAPARFTVGNSTLALPWDAERLATDGDRVALIACGHVFVWSPTRKDVVQAENVASLTQMCNSPEFYSPARLYDVAIAGNRVAWGYHQGNTGQQAELWVSSLSGRRTLVSLGKASGIGGGPWASPLGELTGSDGLLVYSTWGEACALSSCARSVTKEQSVRRAPDGGCPCPALRSEPGPFVPFDVDNGRIVVGGDNALALLDASGAELLSLPVHAAAASLAGNDLVVLVQGTLRHHDAGTGALLHSWPLPNVSTGERCATPNLSQCQNPALVLEDSARGLVTYVIGKQVHVLRLDDGADVVVSPGQTSGFVESGLVYANGAKLRLVRFDELPRR